MPAARPRGAVSLYAAPGVPMTPLAPQAVGDAGAGQPHGNLQPYGVLNFIIALTGRFPAPA